MRCSSLRERPAIAGVDVQRPRSDCRYDRCTSGSEHQRHSMSVTIGAAVEAADAARHAASKCKRRATNARQRDRRSLAAHPHCSRASPSCARPAPLERRSPPMTTGDEHTCQLCLLTQAHRMGRSASMTHQPQGPAGEAGGAPELPIGISLPTSGDDQTITPDVRSCHRAGVWWHASTLRLVSDIGHPVGADMPRGDGCGRRHYECSLSAVAGDAATEADCARSGQGAVWFDPFGRLARDAGDDVEIAVVVEHGDAARLGGGTPPAVRARPPGAAGHRRVCTGACALTASSNRAAADVGAPDLSVASGPCTTVAV